MKRILVPTDFSTHAENALKVAAKIAKKQNCEILLLHMLEIPTQMNDAITGTAGIPEVMLFIRKANETLDNETQKSFLKDIPITKHVQFEKASEGILSFIKKYEIDLIVMGSHGISGLEELLMGSNTEKVVRQSKVPVLVIKNKDFEFNNPHFVFASDFTNEIKAPFSKMLEFASIFDAQLSLVMICTPNSFKTTRTAKKILNDFIAEFELKNHSVHFYNDTNIEKGIINFANDVNADLIGLCTHGRTGLSHFFTGSISEDLVNHASRPVITFKI
ncbi:universal stress protein [Flavobacterium sp. NG2]|uniref:universal stress protein n=1 Tax=Flavobacterium sp. NG2 TaxID=3097547 RepID=UPI002A80CC95|nr:universal stress protein [Flavobacterium sp. NG2]WPR71817.1 universal stress protein [Flavobacterium sp. NG2]